MCAPNLIAFFLLLYGEMYAFGALSDRIDGFWLVLWCFGTAALGWRLLKTQLILVQQQRVSVPVLGQKHLLPALFLMVPGVITDLTALVLFAKLRWRKERKARRKRHSKLWVGEPGADGVIPVQGIPVEPKDDSGA